MTTDSEIVRRSLDDPRAFAALFERHARDIGRFATRALGSDAAEDVLSETFLVAFRRRASFDTTWDDARPWPFGIAANLIKKQRHVEAAQWRSYAAAAAAHEEDADESIGAAAERLDAGAALRALAPRIARLAAKDRETLLLHAWGDMTYEEIGRALSVPTGTVRSRLNRVRRRLNPGGHLVEDQNEGGGHGRAGSRTTVR